MKNVKYIALNIALVFSLSSSIVLAQCDTKLELASANTWDNLRNNEGSLKFVTAKIIKGATEGKSASSFAITTSPNKYLNNYDDQSYCEQKLKQTSGQNRLSYSSPSLSSSDAVSDWISGFSQGKSIEGSELYKACDKSCSPAYEYNISFENQVYKIKALVTCGHARDKDDNKYKIKAICKS